MAHKFAALLTFLTAYALFIVLPTRRPWSAMACAAVAVLTGIMSFREALASVNWNVMGVFLGTLVLADLFVESRMPAYLAERIVCRAKTPCLAILSICLLTGFISAFVENVATFLIIAPIALSMAQKLKISPVKPLIAIAISSNLQGAATLIGDPPSMLLGGYAKMNFLNFFVYHGKPSIFFAVQIGALASLLFLYLVFRRERGGRLQAGEEKVLTCFPTCLLSVLIVVLAFSSLVDPAFKWLAGVLCVAVALAGAIWDGAVNKTSFLRRIKSLDWNTAFFLLGVFVLVGSLSASGWTETIADVISKYIGSNIFRGFALIVLVSMAVSAFVDNVPLLAAMLPVVVMVSSRLNIEPALFLFALLLGASVGGNITPIGAAANIVCVGVLAKEGYKVRFGQFVKIGLPFTMVSLAAACAFLWFVWGQ